MKQIDGGIGGGQVLRLAVSLAALERIPIVVENVRGGRENPGLRAQHVAAIEAVASLTEAEYDGAEVGSEMVTFEPGSHVGGTASVDVGTAGSISLIFDAVLPLAMAADEPIVLHATGGTDVTWAPPIEYLRAVKFPFLEQFGLKARIANVSRGFYPSGGGSATLRIEPATVRPIECVDRGGLDSIVIHSVATSDLSDANVVTRQIDGVRQTVESAISVPVTERSEVAEAPSTGTSVVLVAQYERSRAGFSALGKRGWPAEEVGKAAAESFLSFQDETGAIEAHLADQVLPFLGIGGGTITTPRRTDHISAAASVLGAFDRKIDVNHRDDRVRVTATRPG